jgi:O-antigen/teichoic acid export membrane protein
MPGKFVARAREMLKFGVFATLSGLSSIVLYNLDKVLVYIYLDPESVGTYFAYSLSSMGGIGILAMGVTFALFPRISEKSRSQKRRAFMTINRLVIRLLPLALVGVFIGQVVFLAIIGKYELRLDRLILFSLYGTMTALAAIYSWFASSDKGWGIRGVGITTALAAALFLCSSILWLHGSGVDGFVFSVTLSFGLANISYVLLSDRMTK